MTNSHKPNWPRIWPSRSDRAIVNDRGSWMIWCIMHRWRGSRNWKHQTTRKASLPRYRTDSRGHQHPWLTMNRTLRDWWWRLMEKAKYESTRLHGNNFLATKPPLYKSPYQARFLRLCDGKSPSRAYAKLEYNMYIYIPQFMGVTALFTVYIMMVWTGRFIKKWSVSAREIAIWSKQQ